MVVAQHSPEAEWVRSVVTEFEGPLTLYATRILRNVEQAREVVQDTFLRLCSQERFEVAPHLAEWLFAVCRNRALDVRRKEKRMTLLSEQQADACADGQPTPAREAEDRESASQLFDAVRRLPENQQEVILLKFQHGLSYKQIAHVTSLSVSNVGFLIHMGLKSLRRKFAPPDERSQPEQVEARP